MRNGIGIGLILLTVLAAGCGKDAEFVSNSPAPTPKKYFASEMFNIGDSQLILNKDEFGFIDIPSVYLYYPNPDATLAKINLAGTNIPVIGDKLYRRVDITAATLATTVVNMKKDSGGALDAANHTMINYIYFNSSNELCVDLELMNAVSGAIVVDRTICEE